MLRRAQARAGRRRPMRIEFCEADCWRRSTTGGGRSASAPRESPRTGRYRGVGQHRPQGLAGGAHRAQRVALLVTKADATDPDGDALITQVITRARSPRRHGEKRARRAAARSIERLAELDGELLAGRRAPERRTRWRRCSAKRTPSWPPSPAACRPIARRARRWPSIASFATPSTCRSFLTSSPWR